MKRQKPNISIWIGQTNTSKVSVCFSRVVNGITLYDKDRIYRPTKASINRLERLTRKIYPSFIGLSFDGVSVIYDFERQPKPAQAMRLAA